MDEKMKKTTLEEAAENFAVSYDQGTCDGIAQDCFIAGAEWQEKHLDTVKANTLEELIEYLSKRFDVSYAKLARIVVKTAKWQKQQMLKDAMDGMITCANLNRYILVPKLDESLTYGKKVKIIIVKEDKK